MIFWGTFFPLISQAVTGTSAQVGPPWFDRYTVPLALILVLLSGIGPVIAWRRATLSNARRNFALPLAAAGAMAVAAYTVIPIGSSVPTVILFCCAMFVLASIGQEFWRGSRARRAISSEAPPLALLSMVRRNRRRYGGYIVHTGIAVLFIGVAASSTFQHEQELSLQVGQSVRVGAYTMRYVKPTARVVNDPSHTGATLTLGAVLRVTRGGHYVTTLRPAADYYPTQPIFAGQVVADLISGDAVSRSALQVEPAPRPVGGDQAAGHDAPGDRRRSPGGGARRARRRVDPDEHAAAQAAPVRLRGVGRDRRRLQAQPAAGRLHPDLLAACDVDLARRADRAARRADRDLAAAGSPAGAHPGTLLRARRAGARPRLAR